MVLLLGLSFLVVGAVGLALMGVGAAAATNAVSVDLLTSGPIRRLLGVVGTLIPIISPVFLVVGGGLLRRASWARPLAFAVAMMSVFSFPVGTCIALVTFAVLSRSDGRAFFEPAATVPAGRAPDVERSPPQSTLPDAPLEPIVTITCDIGIDDLVAFAEYHSARSPAVRRSYYWSVATGALAVLVVLWVWGFRETGGWAGAAVALVGWVVYLNWRTRTGNRRYYRRVYSEGANRGLLGKHRLSADAQGLRVATDVTDSRTRWSGVDRIEEAPGLAFIYVGSMNAYTVPEARVVEGDFREFVDAVRRLHANARDPQ
jgi:hypothetical protein